MQVRIAQFTYPTSKFCGKWYAYIGNQFQATYFNKESCKFESCMQDDGYVQSAGFLAHLVKKAYPDATITIEPTKVK
jgi:putative lipase involved disintegration of autophagic bodies